MPQFPKGFCEYCQFQGIANEVRELSGLVLETHAPGGEFHATLWLAAAYRWTDEYRVNPVFSNYAPTKVQAAKDLLAAIEVSTFE